MNRSVIQQIVLFVALVFAHNPIFAQLSNHGLIWHFGYNAGLDFSSGMPVVLPNTPMNSFEGCAVWCDSNGQLLAATNGGGSEDPFLGLYDGLIWDGIGNVVENMGEHTSGGGFSSSQGAVFIPKPGDPQRLLLFTVDQRGGSRGIRLYELAIGLGNSISVIQKNIPVFAPATECITAIPHPNGTDFWIVSVQDNSQEFVVIPVTTTGIGAPFLQPRTPSNDARVLKASPDGKLLSITKQVFDFDAQTGTIQFKHDIPEISSYTHSFSPSSRYLYGYNNDNVFQQIVRYDLQSNMGALASETVGDLIDFTFNGLMQIGPDGNLYIMEQLDSDLNNLRMSLSEIRCPDSEQPVLQRSLYQFDTDPNGLGLFTSLPNFADYIFATPQSSEPDTLDVVICDAEPKTLQAEMIPNSQYQWSTGAITASIDVDTTGFYSVNVSNGCSEKTTYFNVRDEQLSIAIEVQPYSNFCQVLPLTLQAIAQNATQLTWSDGSMADSLRINNTGTFTVTASNTACGTASATFTTPDEDCCQFSLPNAFTPDGDETNATFGPLFIQCDQIERMEMVIHNRWGAEIFTSNDRDEKWDGTINGNQAPIDVYFCTIRYKIAGKEEQYVTSAIHLLR